MAKKGKKKREPPLVQSDWLKAELEKLRKKTYTGGGGDTGFRAISISLKPKKKAKKKGEK